MSGAYGEPVPGYCPACGYKSLRLKDFLLFCSRPDCPRPSAAEEILRDAETEHIVQLKVATFTVRHPLRERLDDALLKCSLHAWLANEPERPFPTGQYRVKWTSLRDAPGEWERL